MRTIYWYLHFVFSTIAKIPQMYKVKRMQESQPEEEVTKYVNKVISDWAMSQIKASGSNIIVEGYENIPDDQGVLFVSNHQSNFDIAIFMACIPKFKGYISKIEVQKLPLIRTWMKYMKCIFIDRNDIKQTASAILGGIELLKAGYSLVIFPEGTRSKGGPVAEFKQGSFKLATKSKVPIIPVTIDGSYKIMEQNKNFIKPADVYVCIHKPINTTSLTKEQSLNLAQYVKDIIVSSLQH